MLGRRGKKKKSGRVSGREIQQKTTTNKIIMKKPLKYEGREGPHTMIGDRKKRTVPEASQNSPVFKGGKRGREEEGSRENSGT